MYSTKKERKLIAFFFGGDNEICSAWFITKINNKATHGV